MVAYSGYSRELTTSGFNTRVQECRQAAQAIALMADVGPVQRLSDISEDMFYRFGHRLPPLLGRRAKHYFDEVNRVHEGVKAWKKGRIDIMGQLMYGTYKSSVELYECGIPALYDLQEIVSTNSGIVGSRFMGGGYGGCVVGFVKKDFATTAAESVRETYRKRHPEVADRAAVYLTQSADGIHFL
jgi:galactokinase